MVCRNVAARCRLARPSAVLALIALAFAAGCGGGGSAADPGTAAVATPQAAGPQILAATSAATPTATTTVVLRASASLYQATGVAVTLLDAGVAFASLEVRAATATDYTYTLPGTLDGDLLDIVVTNAADAQGAPLRHLKIESLTIAGNTYLPSDSRMSFDRGDGSAAFDGQDVRPGRGTITANGALRLRLPTAQERAATDSATTAAAAAPAPGYYVDAVGGDDSAAGSVVHPWRTLARLAAVQLQAGQGVYLRCGSLWRETLTLTAAQLADGSTVAGYGAECSKRKAVISGADDFSGSWTQNGNIWSRSLPAGTPKITQLFVEGLPMRTAQWPSPGAAGAALRPFALAASAAAATGSQLPLQTADAATLAGRDLVGATVQLRTQPWFIETRRSAGIGGGLMQLDSAPTWPLLAGAGYVLQDKLWMLDSPGEFFHDSAAQRLYLIAPTTGAPADLNTALVEGSVRNVALSLAQRSGLVVRDLSLRAAGLDGLRLSDTPQAQLTQIEALDNGSSGITIAQSQALAAGLNGATLAGSLVAGNGSYGVNATGADRVTISGNRLLANGTGAHQQANALAAVATGPGGQVADNTIDGAGYIGIGYSALGGSDIARNTVMGYCSRLSDCGAIYTWQGRAYATAEQSATVENNRILGSQAQTAGAVGGGVDVVAGIYIDDFSSNVAVRGNVLSGMPMGIFAHNASNLTVENNHIWLPTQAALWASMDQTDADWMTGNVFRNNDIVPLVQAQAGAGALPVFTTAQVVRFWHTTAGEAALAAGRNSFSGNTVTQLQGPLAGHAWLRGAGSDRTVDAIDWHALNPAEPLPLRPARYDAIRLALGPELVQSGGFDSGLGPWRTWQNPAGTGMAVQPLASLAGCTGPCIGFTAGDPGDLLASVPFSMRTGVPHVYRWTAVMPAASDAVVGSPYISREVTPWDSMADSRDFTGYGPRHGAAGETLSYEVFFAPKAADLARVNLQLQSLHTPVAFDNVSVREITGTSVAAAADWAALAWAPADASRSVGCAELGWPAGCSAIGPDGMPVSLPVAVSAGTQLLLLRGDSPFRR